MPGDHPRRPLRAPDLQESGTLLVLFLCAHICPSYAQMCKGSVSGLFQADLLCHCEVWISPGFVRVVYRNCFCQNELTSGSTPAASTILQDATRLSGVALGETRALSPFIFKGFWGFPHPSRFISHRSNSSCFPAFPSLFGPYSPFLPALVRTSSDWVNPFRINGSSRKGRFRGLREHALCPGS